MRLLIGLMSGTSMDGIDAALVDMDSHQLITAMTHPYSPSLQALLYEVTQSNIQTVARFKELDTLVGREFATAVLALLKMARVPSAQILAIGSHGQTIFHDATAEVPYTVQVGCGHTLAELTGIEVIADFRTRDLVVGGKGAPFAPLYHQVLFAAAKKPLAVVNIGGIANLTCLKEQEVWGYDTGPGNCLLDGWVRQHLAMRYDTGGQWAASGKVIQFLLDRFLADPYFTLKPPKSLGKEYFSQAWLLSHLQGHERPEDVQATLNAFTARTIAKAIVASDVNFNEVIICGGGIHNQTLINALSHDLAQCKVVNAEHYGVNPDFIEAMMFAWLAEKTITKTPLDFRKITGAKQPVIAGVIYPVFTSHQRDNG